jgi:CHAP domain
MTLQDTLERVSAIRQALADPATMVGAGAARAGGAQAPAPPSSAAATGSESAFAAELKQASSGLSATPGSAAGLGGATGLGAAPVSSYASLQSLNGVAGSSPLSASYGASQSTLGGRLVAIAESQLGQAEQPPGSNESPAIAQYRSATAGAVPGAPWCAYFASWVARQAGEPIGEQGQGAGSVAEVWSWAQSAGRAIANGPGVVPRPGDLIVFGDEHVGIVRDVLANGQIQTIEGNYENKVAANVRSPGEATGYVQMS